MFLCKNFIIIIITYFVLILYRLRRSVLEFIREQGNAVSGKLNLIIKKTYTVLIKRYMSKKRNVLNLLSQMLLC